MGTTGDAASYPYFPLEILMGSKNDLGILNEAKLPAFLKECDVPYAVTALSAHRHTDELRHYCRAQNARAGDRPLVFLALAGKKNVLSDMIEVLTTHNRVVIASVLPSKEDPSQSRDILPGMMTLTSGTAVLWTGYDIEAVFNAGVNAIKVLNQAVPDYRKNFHDAMRKRAEDKPHAIQFETFIPQGTLS